MVGPIIATTPFIPIGAVIEKGGANAIPLYANRETIVAGAAGGSLWQTALCSACHDLCAALSLKCLALEPIQLDRPLQPNP